MHLAFLLAGIAVEACVAAFSLIILWPDEAAISPAFAWIRIGGRTVKSTTAWLLSLYLIGFLNKPYKVPPTL
jgi:hypothetical protein